MKLSNIKTLLHSIYELNSKLDEDSQSFTISPILVGDPGIGKTSMVRQFAKELGKNVSTLRLSELDDPGQLLGFPYKLYPVKTKYNTDEQGTIVGGEVVYMPENQITKDSHIVGTPVTRYAKPDFVAALNEGDILLVDDYGRQLSFFNNAIMGIVHEKGNLSWQLPKGCMIILTGNSDNGEYQVNELDDAQKRRLLYVDVDFSVDDWGRYCETEGISLKYVQFIKNNPLFVKTKSNEKGLFPSKLTEIGLILKYNEDNISKCKDLLKLYLEGDKYSLLVNEFSTKKVSYDFEPYFEDLIDIEEASEDLSKLSKKELYNSYKELEFYLNSNIKGKEKEYSDKLIALYEKNILPKDSYFAIINTLVKNHEDTTLFFADHLIELNNL